jgi:hypothetical protein
VPVLLPQNYLLGIDQQEADFEVVDIPCYLNGTWSPGGRWYFYIYAFILKTPVGLLAITAASMVVHGKDAILRSLPLILPMALIVAVVSCHTAFTVHSRYALPAFGFWTIWISQIFANQLFSACPVRTLGCVVCLIWSVTSTLFCSVHSLSYFNELVGGPANGHKYLLDSNVAWGQDHLFLKTWHDNNLSARPLFIAAFGWVDPIFAGVDFTPFRPLSIGDSPRSNSQQGVKGGLKAGWYVVDVNHLHGSPLCAPDGTGNFLYPIRIGRELLRFREQQPEYMVGYSMRVFHIPRDTTKTQERESASPM